MRKYLRKEQDLDGESKTKVQGHDDDQQNLAGLDIGSAEHGIQISDQEDTRRSKSNSHKDPVQNRDWRPRNQGHRDPDEVRIAVQTNALEQVCRFSSEPLQSTPQGNRNEEGISIDQTRSAREQGEVVDEVFLSFLSQVLRDGACEEENDDDGGRDPKGTIEIGVSI